MLKYKQSVDDQLLMEQLMFSSFSSHVFRAALLGPEVDSRTYEYSVFVLSCLDHINHARIL